MDRAICELRDERDRAARDTLALEGWKCSRSSVAWAVEAMLANSQQSTTALGWLLRQIGDLPESQEKEEAMAKVLDLSFAIAALARAEAVHIVVPFPSQTRALSGKVSTLARGGGEVVHLHGDRDLELGSPHGERE